MKTEGKKTQQNKQLQKEEKNNQVKYRNNSFHSMYLYICAHTRTYINM